MNADGTFNPWRNTNWSPAGGGTYQDTLDMFLSEQEKKARELQNQLAPVNQLDAYGRPMGSVEFRSQLMKGPNGFGHGGRGYDTMGTGEMNMIGKDGISYMQRQANFNAARQGGPSPYQSPVAYSGMQQQRQAEQRRNQYKVPAPNGPAFSGLGQSGNSFGNMKPRRPFR